MQWPSHYNHLVYHVPPASLYEQFLKLLNVHKACSDLDKGPALSWQLYSSLLFPIQWLIHAVINFSYVQLWTPLRKRFFNIEHEEFQIHVSIYGWLKNWGVMQEVSHSHNVWQNRNEITQFTPELWFYDAFWLTSTNILKLVMQEVSRAIFSLLKKSKIILLSRNFISWRRPEICWTLFHYPWLTS